MRRAPLLLLALALLAGPAVALAAECTTTTVADLEDEVMCSVCGTTIGLAREAPQAKRERAFIARLIASCRSKDEIKAALVTEFGPAVLAEPSRRGFSASAHLVPVVGGAAALLVVLLSLLRWRRRTAPAPADPPTSASTAPLPKNDARRLDSELERLR
jgi:cytochrome c-type biogenesis protein CcmH/NrfF